MAQVRIPAILSVMLLFVAACSGGSSDPSEGSSAFSVTAAFQADGPLRGHQDSHRPRYAA